MKYDCDSRRLRREAKEQARKAAKLEWHPFFAVLPVKIGPHDCRFLEWVERRRVPRRLEINTGMGCFIQIGHREEYRARAGR